jgi:hypothetical protein
MKRFSEKESFRIAARDGNGEIVQRITVDFANDQDPTFLGRPEFGVTGFDIITLDLSNGNQAHVLQILTKDWAPTPVARRQQASNLTGVVQPPSHAFGGIDPSGNRASNHHYPMASPGAFASPGYGGHPTAGAPSPGAYGGRPTAGVAPSPVGAYGGHPTGAPSPGHGGHPPHPAGAPSPARTMAYSPAPSQEYQPARTMEPPAAYPSTHVPTQGVPPHAARIMMPAGPSTPGASPAAGMMTPPRTAATRTTTLPGYDSRFQEHAAGLRIPSHVEIDAGENDSRSRSPYGGEMDDLSVATAMMNIAHIADHGDSGPNQVNTSYETYDTAHVVEQDETNITENA